MRRFLALAGLLACLFPAAAQPAGEKASALRRYMEQCAYREPLKGALLGVSVKDAQGRTVVEYNADRRLMPASNLKLVTTGTALHAFGPEYRFQTQLGYSGTVKDGTLEGDLYILGGGDPTIGAKDSLAYKPEALFWKWKTLLRQAGIERIHGRIIGDGHSYEGMLEYDAWDFSDVGTYYGTGCNSLSFYENTVDYSVSAALQGAPVQLQQLYPDTPWMHLQNYGVTGPAGTGNSLYMYTTDLAPYEELRGSFATDRRPKTEHFSNKYGDLTCAYYFWRNLRETGWEVTGEYARIDRSGRIAGPDFVPGDRAASTLVLIDHTESPALADIARKTNVESDNFYAESLLRAMGEAASGNACYDSCLVAIHDVLQDLGLPDDGIHQTDGSGLSRTNYLSPDWMTGYLTAMQRSPAFDAFLASLPAPGQGTLSVVQIENGRRVRMKSGSFGGTLCYSGYILSPTGEPQYSFSLLTNNCTAPTADVRAVLMGILTQFLR